MWAIFEKFKFGLDIQMNLWYVVVLEKGLILCQQGNYLLTVTLALAPSYFRHKPCKRHKASRWYNKIPNSTTGSRFARTYNFRNYRNVLCEKRFDEAGRCDRWV